MNQTCVSCNSSFELTSEDLLLIDKLTPEIGGVAFPLTPPDECENCRLMTKLAFAPGTELFRRNDSWSGKSILSIHPPVTDFPVITHQDYISDSWDAQQMSLPYDEKKNFFEQWRELRDRIPRPSQINYASENCDYCSNIWNSKDSYLVCGDSAVSSMYGLYSAGIYRCVDFYFVIESRFCYEGIHLRNCERVHFSQDSENCYDSMFLFDCKSSRDCFCCTNLRQKQYCVFNKQLTKAEYMRFMEGVDSGSFQSMQSWKQKFAEFKLTQPHRAVFISSCEDSTGDHITGLKNCHHCFGADALGQDIINCRYTSLFGRATDNTFDVFSTADGSSHVYCSGPDIGSGQSVYFSSNIDKASNIFYCDQCAHLTDCFGCCGLKHRQYCILNTQYTKEEYTRITQSIVRKLMSERQWGKYFPREYSPVSYDHSIAQEYFPLTEPEAKDLGFRWSGYSSLPSSSDISIDANSLPDHIRDIDSEVLSKTLRSSSGRLYRIIKQELEFYKEFNLPLPRYHHLERQGQRSQKRNPWRLWMRACMECGKAMHTSYSLDRKERVVCLECYSKVLADG
jgi:hypothetical protein